MKRIAVLLALAALAVPGPAAQATHEYGRYDERAVVAPVPCTVACPGFVALEEARAAACAPAPDTIPGSWADVDLSVTPPATGAYTVYLDVQLSFVGDWDLFACLSEPWPGTDTYYPPLIVDGTPPVCDVAACTDVLWLPVCTLVHWPQTAGCSGLPVGTPLRIRAVNWLDPTGQATLRYGYSLPRPE